MTEPTDTTIEEPAGSLEAATAADSFDALAAVASRYPECLTAWAALGEAALADNRTVEAYAYFRVGYHRGLDRIRRAGWRGSGRVPWAHEPNPGFLRSLQKIGYVDGVAPEPLGPRIPMDMPGEEAAKLGFDTTYSAMKKAGVI